MLYNFPITEPIWVRTQTKVLVPQNNVLSFAAEVIVWPRQDWKSVSVSTVPVVAIKHPHYCLEMGLAQFLISCFVARLFCNIGEGNSSSATFIQFYWTTWHLILQISFCHYVKLIDYSITLKLESKFRGSLNECHPRCVGKLDRWEGSQNHNTYDI